MKQAVFGSPALGAPAALEAAGKRSVFPWFSMPLESLLETHAAVREGTVFTVIRGQ
jgi:hypothetical protein